MCAVIRDNKSWRDAQPQNWICFGCFLPDKWIALVFFLIDITYDFSRCRIHCGAKGDESVVWRWSEYGEETKRERREDSNIGNGIAHFCSTFGHLSQVSIISFMQTCAHNIKFNASVVYQRMKSTVKVSHKHSTANNAFEASVTIRLKSALHLAIEIDDG